MSEKAVMISIQPKWVEKIAKGEKTIEVRKTRPKIETPFKLYIYCTYGKANENYMLGKRGKVIGSFTCKEIEPLTEYELLYDGHWVEEKTRVPQKELLDYKGKNDFLYAWHISNLKIYDKPRELSEFKQEIVKGAMPKKLIRPPQSWFYIEEGE